MGREGRSKAISDYEFAKNGLGRSEQNKWTISAFGEISRAVYLDVERDECEASMIGSEAIFKGSNARSFPLSYFFDIGKDYFSGYCSMRTVFFMLSLTIWA